MLAAMVAVDNIVGAFQANKTSGVKSEQEYLEEKSAPESSFC